MSITTVGKRLLNFEGSSTQDVFYSGNAVIHLGTGEIDVDAGVLGNEVFTASTSLRQVVRVPSDNNNWVTDVVILVAEITNKIQEHELTEAGLSINGEFAILENLTDTSSIGFTLKKGNTGSMYVEWALIRTRPNQSQIIHTGEDFVVYMNPLVSPTNENQGLLQNLGNVVIRKDAVSLPEYSTADIKKTTTTLPNGDLQLAITISLRPADALKGAYPYNTVKEIRIGATGNDDLGLFSVIWNHDKTREPSESFTVSFVVVLRVEEIDGD